MADQFNVLDRGAIQLWKTGTNYRLFPQVGTNATTTSTTLGNGTLRLSPLYVPNTLSLSHLGGEITAAGEAGSVLRLGLYRDDGTGIPGALVGEGTIDGTSVTVQEVAATLTLAPGWYWGGGAVQAAPTTQPGVRCLATTAGPAGIAVATGLPGVNQAGIGYSATGATGALPATFGFIAGSVAGSVPRVHFRLAS